MANRKFDLHLFTIQKRVASVWAVVAVPSGTAPVLQKWNYANLGTPPAATGFTQAVGTLPYTNAPSTAGGSGFPTGYVQGTDCVKSVTRTAQGLWTVVLQDNWQRVLGIHVDMGVAGGLANIVGGAENFSITNMGASGGSIIGVALLSATGAVADPTAGASTLVRIRFDLHDATEP